MEDVFIAVGICLGENPSSWTEAQKMCRSSSNLLKRIKSFDPATIDARMLKRLKPLVEKEHFDPAVMKTKSCAAESSCRWVLAVYDYGLSHISPQRRPMGSI